MGAGERGADGGRRERGGNLRKTWPDVIGVLEVKRET